MTKSSREADSLARAEIRLRDAIRVLDEEPTLKEQRKQVHMALRSLELTRQTLEAGQKR